MHFRRAIALNSDLPDCHFYYGRWLNERGRTVESIAALNKAVSLRRRYLDPRDLLLAIYMQHRQWGELQALTADTLALSWDRGTLERYQRARAEAVAARAAGVAATEIPESRESFLELSLRRYRDGDYASSIAAARGALRLDPNYAEAYNNLAAAYAAMGQWSQAAYAARRALSIKPDFPLARNNLAWALSHASGR